MRGALDRVPQLRPHDSGGGNCGEGEGGGVGDGSAAAALIAFIGRCLPSRRRRGMWTPLIGRERPARRGRRGPAPSPRLPPPGSLLPRAWRPRCRAGPAPSRAPPLGTRIEAARAAVPGLVEGKPGSILAACGSLAHPPADAGWGAHSGLAALGPVGGWLEGEAEELGARSTRGVLETRSGWCPWLASSPSVARAALCILICLLRSPPQEPRGGIPQFASHTIQILHLSPREHRISHPLPPAPSHASPDSTPAVSGP